METAPKKRGDCLGGERPCPWIRCKHHMLWWHWNTEMDSWTDNKIANFVVEMPESCTLDFVDAHPEATLHEIGKAVGLTRERIRQLLYGTKGRGIAQKPCATKRMRHPSRRHYFE